MLIRAITLAPFRNFERIRLDYKGEHALIIGGNGKGKSNILEAVSYLSIGKSVRGSKDQQAIPHDGSHFDIQAECSDGYRTRDLRVYYSEKEGKKVFCDGASLPKVSDILGIFKTVHFSPEDVSLVLRFPAQRRRLLDILISQSSYTYLHDLQRYQRVLAQRNYFLKTAGRDSKEIDEAALQAWDAQLARLGGRIRLKRLVSTANLRPLFAKNYQRFSPVEEAADLVYSKTAAGKGYPEGDYEEEQLVSELLEELSRRRRQELLQGHTQSGPHRDHLLFTLNGQPADDFASEGQLKTMLVAWKMAEVRFLESETSQQPVLLLDDVFSELDERRSNRLLEMIDEFNQVILTTPREPEEAVRSRFGEIRLEDQ